MGQDACAARQGFVISARSLQRRANTVRQRSIRLWPLFGAPGTIIASIITTACEDHDQIMSDLGKVWVPMCALQDLPTGKASNVFVNGQRFVIARDGDVVTVLQGYCSHMLYPLKDAVVAECMLTCNLHGSQFDIRDGSVLKWPMPMLPDTHERKRLRTHETRVEDGVVYLAWPARSADKVKIRF
ncbi:MAG: Rieske 2Fe-2S domain-containing protein [Anaerolineae bacterium]|nr:Rieske 2Fe-2S domain-containing protein [Anaerolineae bacterium]